MEQAEQTAKQCGNIPAGEDTMGSMTEQGKGGVDKRVEEIRARVEAATPAPWTAEIWLGNEDGGFAAIGPHHKHQGDPDCWNEDDPNDCNGKRATTDAVFIAHAREDVPYLLSALSAAQGECERLRADMHIMGNAITQVVDDHGPIIISDDRIMNDRPVKLEACDVDGGIKVWYTLREERSEGGKLNHEAYNKAGLPK